MKERKRRGVETRCSTGQLKKHKQKTGAKERNGSRFNKKRRCTTSEKQYKSKGGDIRGVEEWWCIGNWKMHLNAGGDNAPVLMGRKYRGRFSSGNGGLDTE